MSRRKQARPIRVNENENENGYGSTLLNETKSLLTEKKVLVVKDEEKHFREIDNSPPSCSEDDVLIPETSELFCANYPEPQTTITKTDNQIENQRIISNNGNTDSISMDNSILFTPSHVTLEVLENTKVAVAQFAASALAAMAANGADETSLKNLAHLQTSLFSLQNQQIRQIQLIQELQSKLEDRNGTKNRAQTENAEELETISIDTESVEKFNIPKEIESLRITGNTNNAYVTQHHDNINSVNTASNLSNIIIDHNHSIPVMEPNTLEMLQKRTQEVLDSASKGILSGNMIDEMALRKDKNHSYDGKHDPFSKHQCRYCDKIFGSDSALQIHIRSHTGERPFRCNMCSSSFTTKGNLKVHYQRHTQIDAFQMEIMDKFRSPNRVLNFGHSLSHREIVRDFEAVYDGPHRLKSMTLRSDNNTDNVPYMDKRYSHQNEMEIDDNNKLNQSDTTKLQKFIDNMEGSFSRQNRRKRSPMSTSWQVIEPKSSFGNFDETHSTTTHNELIDLSVRPKNAHWSEVNNSQRSDLNNADKYRRKTKLEENDSDGDQINANEANTNMLTGDIKTEVTNPSTDNYVNYSFYPHDVDSTNLFLNRGLHPLSTGGIFNQLGYPGIRGNTTCNICYKTFACHSALEIHYRSHTKERPYKCKICRRGFSTKGNMKQHMLTHKIRDPSSAMYDKSAPSSPPSSDSGNSFASPNSYCDNLPNSHSHRTPSDIDCFNSKSSYVSDGEEIHEIDGDSIASDANVDDHSKHKVNNYVREEELHHLRNNQSFSQLKSNIPTSETIPSSKLHSKLSFENNFPISIPSSSPNPSTRSSYLDESSTISQSKEVAAQPTNSKHLCRICHKNFSSSSAVHIHLRTHTGDKPFHCSVCRKTFTTKGNLKVHMSVHMWTHGVNSVRRQMGSFPMEFQLNRLPFHYSDTSFIQRRSEHDQK